MITAHLKMHELLYCENASAMIALINIYYLDAQIMFWMQKAHSEVMT